MSTCGAVSRWRAWSRQHRRVRAEQQKRMQQEHQSDHKDEWHARTRGDGEGRAGGLRGDVGKEEKGGKEGKNGKEGKARKVANWSYESVNYQDEAKL